MVLNHSKVVNTRAWEPRVESVYHFTIIQNLYLIVEVELFFHKVVNCLYLFLIFELAFPVVHVYPRNQTVPEGRTAVINCTAKGIPRPKLSWTFDNGKPPPADVIIRNSTVHSILELSNTSKGMEGWYTCTATNKAGDAFSNSTLHVSGLFLFLYLFIHLERYWPLGVVSFVRAMTVSTFSVISLSGWKWKMGKPNMPWLLHIAGFPFQCFKITLQWRRYGRNVVF